MAEGPTLLEAIRSSVREGLTKVVFEYDSAQLVKTLNSRGCIPELYGVIADILSYASAFEFVSFAWIPR